MRECRSGKVTSEFGRLEILNDPRTVGMTELFAQREYQETVRARGRVSAYVLTANDALELLAFDSDCDLAAVRSTASGHFDVVRRYHLGMLWWVACLLVYSV